MKILNVDLGDRSYPIYIGIGLLEDKKIITSHIKTKTICIVSNTTVSKLYLENLKNLLDDYQVVEAIIADGEEFKNYDSLNHIYTTLLENQCNRDTTILALGGGVVGDIAGGIREITSALNEMPDDQTKALTFATTADALTNLTNAASTIEEAKLASMAALVQAMTNAEGDNGVGQLANAIQSLITSNSEGREMTITLDGYELGRWMDRRESRNARAVLSQ